LFDLACNCRKKESDNVANQNTHVTTWIESNLLEYFSGFSEKQENESYQAVTSVDTQSDSNNDNSTINDLPSFDDFMNKIFLTPITPLSTSSQVSELLNIYDVNPSQKSVSICTCFHLKNING